jgi:hypothetical protein
MAISQHEPALLLAALDAAGGRYAQRLGADAWAGGAEEAVVRLATAWPPAVEPPLDLSAASANTPICSANAPP